MDVSFACLRRRSAESSAVVDEGTAAMLAANDPGPPGVVLEVTFGAENDLSGKGRPLGPAASEPKR